MFKRNKMSQPKDPKTHILEIGGRAIPLRIKRHARARHLILRINDDGDGAQITVPKRATIAEALNMARDKADWILKSLSDHPTRIEFVAGATVPVLGTDYVLCAAPNGLGVRVEGFEIRVAGKAAHFSRRVTDWLKKKARSEITRLVQEKSHQIDCVPGRISIRDTRSRWGSCGPTGNLNFSWRLVMAPAFVLDYLVAHEVAHLRQRNHGEKFWKLTQSLSDDMDSAHEWMERHAPELYRYG